MIQITLTTCEPLHLEDRQAIGQTGTSMDYIPGTAIRGALALRYRQRTSWQDKDEVEFRQLFLDESASFGPFYPAGMAEKPIVTAFPAPATLHSCKRNTGFYHNDRKHGVRDLLSDFLLPPDAPAVCEQPGCEAEMVPLGGFISGSSGSYRAVQVSKRRMAHTALDLRREVAAAQQLYSLEVIEEQQQFKGSIRLSSRQLEERLIETCLKGQAEIWLGGARSRGHGQIAVQWNILNDPSMGCWISADNSVAKRMNDFQTLLSPVKEQWSLFKDKAKDEINGNQRLSDPSKGEWFSLTLLSNCILRDPWLRFRSRMEPEDLARWVHPDLINSQCLKAICQTTSIDGWNAAHRLPRDTDLAIGAGGVFVFCLPSLSQPILSALERLERDGLGERRVEGFGRVAVVHPVHLEEILL